MDLEKLTREELVVLLETKREDGKRAVQTLASMKDMDQKEGRGLIIKMAASTSANSSRW